MGRLRENKEETPSMNTEGSAASALQQKRAMRVKKRIYKKYLTQMSVNIH